MPIREVKVGGRKGIEMSVFTGCGGKKWQGRIRPSRFVVISLKGHYPPVFSGRHMTYGEWCVIHTGAWETEFAARKFAASTGHRAGFQVLEIEPYHYVCGFGAVECVGGEWLEVPGEYA